MTVDVLAVARADRPDPRVQQVADALTAVVDERVCSVQVASDHDAQGARTVLEALDRDDALLCVMAASRPRSALCWRVVSQARKPVVLVPPGAELVRPTITRALLPLDGSAEAAQAVQQTIRLLDRAGIDLIVLHVFDASTVPMFWDQSAHAIEAWQSEFLSRCGTPTSARLELRQGVPSEHVVRAAEAENVDLIALGWSQQIEPGRARTVRASVLDAEVPVLLVPIGGRP